MLFPTKEIMEISTDPRVTTVASTFNNPMLLRYFAEHCAEELSSENIHFIEAIAPFREDMPAYRSRTKAYAPRNEARRWANPMMAGIYEHFISTSAPEQINIGYGTREALRHLYEEQELTTGIIAPNLTIRAYGDAITEIVRLLGDSMARFVKRIAKLQEDMRKGSDALKSKTSYAIALVEERKHQAAKVKAGRSGTFLFMPFCGDGKPLLQVSSIISRSITPDKKALAEQLGVKLDGTKDASGSFVKADDGSFKVCGRPSDENAAEAFRRGLAALGLGTPKVEAADSNTVRGLADPSWKERQSAKVRGKGKELSDAIGKASRGGKGKFATPFIRVLSRTPGVGAEDAGVAIAVGMAYLNQTRRGPLATKVRTGLESSTAKLGVKKVMEQGNGKYWLCLYEDPTFSGSKLVVREVWLYRGASAPEDGKDYQPRMKPNTQWFCLVSTKEADQAIVKDNLAKSGLI